MGNSEEPAGREPGSPWAREIVVDATLRDHLVATIAQRTDRRYAAVYPINLGALAVHDGRRVITLNNLPLRQRLAELLAGDPQVLWLVVDVREGRCYRTDSTSATNALASLADDA
jgi:hypothetical protein